MPDRPIIQLQNAQNSVTPQGRPIIQLSPADQFPVTNNASYYIHEVPGSMNEATTFGPTFTDIDVGIPRPISKETLTTRYKEQLDYVRREVQRANLSEQKILFTEATEDGGRKSVGKLVDGAEVGKKTFITFVSNEVLKKHGVDYDLQGGVSFSLNGAPSPGQNPFIDRVRAMMVNSGAIQAKTEAYEQMMQADNFIFLNSRRLVSDTGPIAALKTTFHEIGHSFSSASGAKSEQLSLNVVKAFDEGGSAAAIDTMRKLVVGHALEEARAETFALGTLSKQGLIGEFMRSAVADGSKDGQVKRLLSYVQRTAFAGYAERYHKKLETALIDQEVNLEAMIDLDTAVKTSKEEIATAAHAAMHKNVIIPKEMEQTFEPLRRRLISNTYHNLKDNVVLPSEVNPNIQSEAVSSITEQIEELELILREMDEEDIQDMFEEMGVSSKEEIIAKLKKGEKNRMAIASKLSPAEDYAEAMSPIIGKRVESLPKYPGGKALDEADVIKRFGASLQQSAHTSEQLDAYKDMLRKQGIDEGRIDEMIAHSQLSKKSLLPALTDDAGIAAKAVIQSSKQVTPDAVDSTLDFVTSNLGRKTSRNFI